MAALDLTYEQYVEINGGEHCGICGKEPDGRRLDRDHDHKTGRPRGLLCWACNRQLRTWATVEWLRSAAMYLERLENDAG
ncbi:MAG: endonuclease domain-containing protein [Gammaproteobacteria bacterium]